MYHGGKLPVCYLIFRYEWLRAVSSFCLRRAADVLQSTTPARILPDAQSYVHARIIGILALESVDMTEEEVEMARKDFMDNPYAGLLDTSSGYAGNRLMRYLFNGRVRAEDMPARIPRPQDEQGHYSAAVRPLIEKALEDDSFVPQALKMSNPCPVSAFPRADASPVCGRVLLSRLRARQRHHLGAAERQRALHGRPCPGGGPQVPEPIAGDRGRPAHCHRRLERVHRLRAGQLQRRLSVPLRSRWAHRAQERPTLSGVSIFGVLICRF